MVQFKALLYENGQVIEQNDVESLSPALKEDVFLWVDIEVGVKGLDDLIRRFAGDHASDIYTALTAKDTRPRYDEYGDIGLVILRGVNLNPDSEPEDMISARILVGKNFAITVRRRQLMAIGDTREKLQTLSGKPINGGQFLYIFGAALMDRMQGTLFNIDEKIDGLEEQVLKGGDMEEVRKELVDVRFMILTLRRYIVPQKEIFSSFVTLSPSWATKGQTAGFRNVADTVGRYGDALDAARERCSILFEEVKTHLSERVNQNTYLLSIVTAIFLPLGILTGLFGVNVGGMPGINSPYAFGILSACLVLLGLMTGLVLKRKDWF